MRTTDGQQQVDVIYRRIDDEFLDPVHFRSDSVIGCAGVLNAARAGRVTIANAVGNGVADDKLIYTWVPDLIRYYLDEEPVLANADTYRLDDVDATERRCSTASTSWCSSRSTAPAARASSSVRGPTTTLAELPGKVAADPRDWIAQKPIGALHLPTLIDGRIAPRHVDLRPFAVNDGTEVWVLPGGLTRVALPEGELVVNSSARAAAPRTPGCSAAPAGPAPAPQIEFTTADLPPTPPDGGTPPPGCDSTVPATSSPATPPQMGQQQQQAGGSGRAEPDRRVAVLDRSLRGAGRRHRPDPRRAHPAAGRGPVDRRAAGLLAPARADGAPCPPEEADTERVLAALAFDRTARARSSGARAAPGRTPAARARCSRPRSGSPSTSPTTRSPAGRWPAGTARTRCSGSSGSARRWCSAWPTPP